MAKIKINTDKSIPREGGGQWRKHDLPKNVYIEQKPNSANRSTRFKVVFTYDKKRFSVGVFNSVELAVAARDNKMKELKDTAKYTLTHKKLNLTLELIRTPWQGL